jgi:hypothetical protein
MYPYLRRALIVATMAVAAQAGMVGNASAQVTFNIRIGPPAPMYEAVPVLQPGYIWAPGYWAWHEDRHIWVRGRSMVQRTGYRWQPDVWEQRDNRYYRHPGRWERDTSYRAPAPMQQRVYLVERDDGPGQGKAKYKKYKPQKDKKDKKNGRD